MSNLKSVRDTKLFDDEINESEISIAWLDHYRDFHSLLIDFFISPKKQKEKIISEIVSTINVFISFAKNYECLYIVVLLHPIILKYVQCSSLASFIVLLKSKTNDELQEILKNLKQKCNNAKFDGTIDLAKFYSRFNSGYDINEMHIYTTLAFAGYDQEAANEFIDSMYRKANKLAKLDLAPVYFSLFIKSYDTIKKRNAYNQFLIELNSIKKFY